MKTEHWYILSGVDVMADASAKGDRRSSATRSPTAAARRPTPTTAGPTSGQAAAGERADGEGRGHEPGHRRQRGHQRRPRADRDRARYMRDVLDQSGVRCVIVFEGVNDMGARRVRRRRSPPPSTSFISQAHAQRPAIYGATITPFGGNSYYTAGERDHRQSVNTYIRSGNVRRRHRLRRRGHGHVEPAQAAGGLRQRRRPAPQPGRLPEDGRHGRPDAVHPLTIARQTIASSEARLCRAELIAGGSEPFEGSELNRQPATGKHTGPPVRYPSPAAGLRGRFRSLR